eukprot:53836_1
MNHLMNKHKQTTKQTQTLSTIKFTQTIIHIISSIKNRYPAIFGALCGKCVKYCWFLDINRKQNTKPDQYNLINRYQITKPDHQSAMTPVKWTVNMTFKPIITNLLILRDF